MQQSDAASDQQHQVYGHAVDKLLYDATDSITRWKQDYSVAPGRGNEVRCRIYLMLYCMP